MTVVDDYLTETIPSLSPIAVPPTGDLGWGTDLSCTSDFAPGFPDVAQDDVASIRQALVRRLLTPRGSLYEDQDYGLQVAQLLNAGFDTKTAQGYAGAIRNELTKDDRVDECAVTLTVVSLTEIRVDITVTPADPALETFDLVLSVADSAVLLEAL